MESRVRLAVTITIVALIIGVALMAAKSVGNVIARKIVDVTPFELSSVGNEIEAESPVAEDDGSDVLIYNRNLFNQHNEEGETEEVKAEETTPEEPEVLEEIAGDGTRPVLTDLRMLLHGTQVASDPTYSLAMLMPLDGGNDARMMYLSEGSDVMGEARIIKIVRNRVYMVRTTQGDRIEYIDTRTTEEDLAEAKKAFEKYAEKEKAAEQRAKDAQAAADKAKVADAGSGEIVRKIGADTYEVSREVVEAIRKNPNSLKNSSKYGAMPKVQPVYKGGNIGGFRLLGIESDSVYAQLGLKSGDTIIDVNGQTIDGPQKAMALVDALKPDQNVSMKINRAGQEKTLTFQFK